ncbi:MAG: serine/threonine protein kinase [Myxococcota bacterium]
MKQIRRGTRLGKYRLERRLGEGASAEVWLGNDTVQSRKVAVKIIFPRTVEEFGRQAIEKEARVAARLDHPNIVAVRNADWYRGFFLIVTDPALRSLEGYGSAKRSPELALKIIGDVARGLSFAHEKKILHRDVKPANILLYPGRQARLGDFGTARFAPVATRLQTEVGTQAYMAPEHAYGRPRFASDVFSLGLTAYELLTGTLPTWPFEWPFEGHGRLTGRVPEPIQAVLRRSLVVDASRRWANATEFCDEFEKALEKPVVGKLSPQRKKKAKSTTPFEHESRWFKRNYGGALTLQFSCCSCDGPVAESMRVCPWCGTDRNAFSEVTSYPLICPDCEKGVRREWNACPWCYAGRFESNGKPIPADKQVERTCQNRTCDGELRRFMRYCPKCKMKVERPWRVAGLSQCTRCRWPTTDRWRFCPWCARRQRDALRI